MAHKNKELRKEQLITQLEEKIETLGLPHGGLIGREFIFIPDDEESVYTGLVSGVTLWNYTKPKSSGLFLQIGLPDIDSIVHTGGVWILQKPDRTSLPGTLEINDAY